MLAQPPQDIGRLRRNLPNPQLSGPLNPEVLGYFKEYVRLAQSMEKRGTKVRFVFLPVAAAKDDLSQAFEKLFPGHVVAPTLSISELRWVDDTHFDQRSAFMYSRALEPYLRLR